MSKSGVASFRLLGANKLAKAEMASVAQRNRATYRLGEYQPKAVTMVAGFMAVAFLSLAAELQPSGEVAAEMSPGFVSAKQGFNRDEFVNMFLQPVSTFEFPPQSVSEFSLESLEVQIGIAFFGSFDFQVPGGDERRS